MEKVTEAIFPIEEFTPFPTDTAPTAVNVRQLKKEMIQCAMAVPTTLGGGAHGHLGMILPAAEYAALNPAPGDVFDRPDDPPDALDFAGNASRATIALAQQEYNAELQAYTMCNKVDLALKIRILKAVPKIYLLALCDELFEFANVTPAEMLHHLETTYGAINEDDLAANLEACEAAWDPNTPIEIVFANTNKCAQFAAAGNDDISDANKVRLTLKALEKSGVMEEAISDWRKKTVANRTWANMPTHFTTYNKERLRKSTAAQAGFNSANATQQQPKETNNKKAAAAKVGTIELYYCFTHGLGKNPDHTSMTCTNPCAEHKKEATVDNMMGGNNTIRRRRNERSVITRPPRATNAETN